MEYILYQNRLEIFFLATLCNLRAQLLLTRKLEQNVHGGFAFKNRQQTHFLDLYFGQDYFNKGGGLRPELELMTIIFIHISNYEMYSDVCVLSQQGNVT